MQETVHGNRPGPAPQLIGRDADLDALDHLLKGGTPLVTIVGPGGVGKTTLARACAGRARDRGVHTEIVELSGLDDATLLPYLLGTVEQTVSNHARALVVLDNLEHLLPVAADHLGGLLAMSHVQVLVTSRSTVRVAQETVYDLAPLALPGGVRDHDLLASPAVQFLLDRAARRAPRRAATLSATSAALRDTAALCARLDGLPLALELAASCLRSLDVPTLIARLDAHLELPGSLADLPVRQRSLHHTAQWSYELLEDQHRVWFRSLGVFRGHFALDDAETLGGHLGLATSAAEAVSALVEASLVRYDPTRPDGPYEMLDTLRAFAERELDALDERHYAHEALGELLVQGARFHSPRLYRDAPPALGFFRRREDDLREFMRRGALPGQDPRRGAELLALVTLYWVFVRRNADHLGWYESYEASLHLLPSLLQAELTFEWGRMAQMSLRLDVAERRLTEALHLVPEDATLLRMKMHACRGVVAVFREEYDLAAHHHEEAVRLAVTMGDPGAIVRQRANLAVTRMTAGRYEEAHADLERLVPEMRAVGDLVNLGTISEHATRVALRLGKLDEAERHLATAEDITGIVTPDAVNEVPVLLGVELRLRRGETDLPDQVLRDFLWADREPVSVGWACALRSVVLSREGDPIGAARLRGLAEHLTHGLNRNEFRHADDLLDAAWTDVVSALGEDAARSERDLGASQSWRDLAPPWANRTQPAVEMPGPH